MSATAGPSEPPVLWRPSEGDVERATLTRFARWVQETRGVKVTASYEQLRRWSTDDLEGFWSAVWEFFDVQHDGEAVPVIDEHVMPGARWFPRARLNYAEHVFRDRDPDALALQYASEDQDVESWTWGRLRSETARVATGLTALGVGPGDRVAAYLPNVPETVAAVLACAAIGAVWSSAAPEFGTRAVVDRFSQIEPKVLLAIDGYRYGGKDFDRRETIARLRRELPSLEQVVVLDNRAAI